MIIPASKESIRSFILFLVYSNLITAISVSTATLLTFFLLNYPVILPVILAVFSGTLLIYTLNRFTDIHEDSINLPERVEFIRKYGKIIFLISLIMYVFSLVVVGMHSSIAVIAAISPLIIAFSYSYFRLKRFFLVKNILISTGVSCSVLIVGAYYNDFAIRLLLLAIIIFGSILVNTIIFDIKDLKGDKLCQIQTIPVKCGIRTTKFCCFVLLLPLFLIALFLMTIDIRSSIILPFLGYITTYTYFSVDSEQYPWWYFGLYVDGEYIFLLGILLILFMAGTVHFN